MWNAKILTKFSQASSDSAAVNSVSAVRKDPDQLSKMQEKLIALRDVKAVLDNDRISNLVDLNNKFDLIETTNMEFYGQRQLTYMMRSLFYEKELINANYSIVNFVKGTNYSLEEESVNSKETEESAMFEDVMIRAQTAKSFKEFYRQNLSEIRYEMAMHQTRLMQFLSIRGTRRILEKKKYKCLGEISTLTKILDEIRKRHSLKLKNMAVKKVKHVSEKTFSNFLGIPGMETNRTDTLDSPNVNDKSNEDQARQSIIPETDWFYILIYKEVDQLRSSGMSR